MFADIPLDGGRGPPCSIGICTIYSHIPVEPVRIRPNSIGNHSVCFRTGGIAPLFGPIPLEIVTYVSILDGFRPGSNGNVAVHTRSIGYGGCAPVSIEFARTVARSRIMSERISPCSIGTYRNIGGIYAKGGAVPPIRIGSTGTRPVCRKIGPGTVEGFASVSFHRVCIGTGCRASRGLYANISYVFAQAGLVGRIPMEHAGTYARRHNELRGDRMRTQRFVDKKKSPAVPVVGRGGPQEKGGKGAVLNRGMWRGLLFRLVLAGFHRRHKILVGESAHDVDFHGEVGVLVHPVFAQHAVDFRGAVPQ